MARPSKLTQERKKILFHSIKLGQPLCRACLLADISFRTLRNWIIKGEKAKSGQYFQFLQEIKKAEAEGEVARLSLIFKAAKDGTWTAAAWIQERRFPENYGKRVVVDANIQKGLGVKGRAMAEKFDEILSERDLRVLPTNPNVSDSSHGQDDLNTDTDGAKEEAENINFKARIKNLAESNSKGDEDEHIPKNKKVYKNKANDKGNKKDALLGI